MTPIERLIDDMTAAARMRAWYRHADWHRRITNTIHAMATVHHRGIGQRFRFAAARIRAIQLGGNP